MSHHKDKITELLLKIDSNVSHINLKVNKLSKKVKNLEKHNHHDNHNHDNHNHHNHLSVPVGTITQYAGVGSNCDGNPVGWLFCDGSEQLICEYQLLYNVIGTRYGEACSSDKFILPNLRGRFPIGAEHPNYQLGTIGGNYSTTLDITNIPSHTHASNAVGTPGNLGLVVINNGTDALTSDGTNLDATSGEPNISGSSTNVALQINNTGGNSESVTMPFSIVPSYCAVNYLIKY